MSPAVLGWVQRDHERKLARAARLHEQRLAVYADLGAFLELERARIERVEPRITMHEARKVAYEKLGVTERVMQEELATL